ncbi:MAG: peptidylprolyl isomerase [Pseudomonadota bacterium]
MVTLTTTLGDIRIELLDDAAPLTTENFRQYVTDGFYADTVFHRVIPNFMIQGGGHLADLSRKETREPIKNEADNGLKNERGTLSMARTADIHSATSQFFVNVADNAFLDHGGRDFGYAVFARVVGGMDVVDAIAATKTGTVAGHQDVPLEPVSITSATLEG